MTRAGTLRIYHLAGGVGLRVRVSAGSRRTRLLGIHGDLLKVAVQAPPERGLANQQLCTFLADQLGLSRGAIQVTTGHTSRDKTLLVRELPADQLQSRLEALLGG